jgi:hypothetical protein
VCFALVVSFWWWGMSQACVRAQPYAAKCLGIDITLIEADAQQLPFADDRLDTVVCTLALSSIPDPSAAINEMSCRGSQFVTVAANSPAEPGQP